MPESRAEARQRRLSEGLPTVVEQPHIAVVREWFLNGCRSKRAACIAVGLSPSTAGYMFRKAETQIEIARMRAVLARQDTELTEAMIVAEYRKIAFASLGEMLEIQDDGGAWLDMSSITDDQKAALAEYHVETYQVPGDENAEGYQVKKSRIKFHDKKAALDSLARIKGMFKDKLDVNVHVLSLSDKVQMARQRLQEPTTIEGELVDEPSA